MPKPPQEELPTVGAPLTAAHCAKTLVVQVGIVVPVVGVALYCARIAVIVVADGVGREVDVAHLGDAGGHVFTAQEAPPKIVVLRHVSVSVAQMSLGPVTVTVQHLGQATLIVVGHDDETPAGVISATQGRPVGIGCARAGHHRFPLNTTEGRGDTPDLINLAGTDALENVEFIQQRVIVDRPDISIYSSMLIQKGPFIQISLFIVADSIVCGRPASEIVDQDVFCNHVVSVAETCMAQVADVVGDQQVRVVIAKELVSPDVTLAGQTRVEGEDHQLARHWRWPGARGGIRAVIRARCGLMGERGRPAGQDTASAVARKTRHSGAQRGASGQFQKLPSIHEAVPGPGQAIVLHALVT